MKKINYQKFKENLENTGKTYYSLSELKKFYPNKGTSIKVLLSNWTKRKMIYHLGRGVYTFNLSAVDYLSLGNFLNSESYLSFEYALFHYHLIDQVPSVITYATLKRSRKVKMQPWVFEYTHLKKELFFGYELNNKVYIATPEKALADLLYVASRGKRLIEIDTLCKDGVNKKELKKVLKRFPLYVIKLAKKYQLI